MELIRPKWGEIFMNPDMARVLSRSRALGPLEDSIMATLAGAIVDKIRKHGGVMTSEDLNNHGLPSAGYRTRQKRKAVAGPTQWPGYRSSHCIEWIRNT
jgi:hypothetical protein